MLRHLTLALGLLALATGPAPRAWAVPPAQHADETQAHPAAADPAPAHGDETPELLEHPTVEEEQGILEFKPSMAVATVIIFGLLLFLLWRFAWGPLAKALDDRESYNTEAFRQAEHARAEAERMLAEHRSIMAQAQDQVRAILDEARRDADSTAAGILQKAQAEAEASRDRAERDIAQARDNALAEIWTKSADMAVAVAGKVLARELGPDEQRRLVDVAMTEMPAAPANGQQGAPA